MSDWHQIVFNLAVVTYAQGGRGSWAHRKAEDGADVLWTCWKDGDGTPHARVIRGRDLTGPDLRHAAHVVENEDQAVLYAEDFGEEIPTTEDGGTYLLPEPAVPEHHVAMLKAGRYRTCDGLRPLDDVGRSFA
ncbi:hypothetical protein [Methylobacterium sp. JK268]